MKYKTLTSVLLATSFIVFCIASLGLFKGIDATLTDRLFSQRSVNPQVIIVGIDTKTLTELGQWPLPRSLFAQGLQNIIESKPHGIGIDILFADSSRLGSEDDAILERTLRESTVPITLPVEATTLFIKDEATPRAEEIIHTLPAFTGEHIKFGHINLIKDRDGIVRRFPQTIGYRESRIPSFSGQVVERVYDDAAIANIVWSGKPGTIHHISFTDVIHKRIDLGLLKDSFVFIGATAADLHDEQTTPTSGGTPMAGVEIQAQIGAMLLSDLSLTPITTPLFTLWLLTLGLVPILFFFYVRAISIALVVTCALFLGNIIAITTLFDRGILVSIVQTSLTLFISAITAFSVRYFILERERREIRGVFSKYVSGAVLEELLKDPGAVKLGGSEAEVTIFFSDIRGFTTLSEKLTPHELTDLLNRYLTRMTDIILNDQGVVDKYIGDAIMAFWGAPLTDAHHAYRAVQSSLTMLEALDAFNAENEKNGYLPINIGIGLNTGKVIVGNMGSTQRFDYTIMGDAVNLGSRIESQTKTYGVRLLVSEMTIAALTHTKHADAFLIREVDKVTVKGKKEPVALFEIVERKHEENVRTISEDFEKLRTRYYSGSWKEVIDVGEKILARTNDGPTTVLTERAKTFIQNPPESWNGVYELTSK